MNEALQPLATSAAQETATTVESILHVAWKLPLWLTIVLALGLASMVFLLYRSERGRAGIKLRWLLSGLRFALLMLVLWMLAGWSWLRFKSDQPELIVVIDRSASMSTRDISAPGAPGGTLSRWERAVELFDRLPMRERARLARNYQLQGYTLAETLDPLIVDFRNEGPLMPLPSPDGATSSLGDGLTRLLQRQTGKGTAAIIFVSDGINTSGTSLAEVAKGARRAAIPVLTVAVGEQSEQPDLRLADLLIDRDVYFGDQVTAELSVIVSDVPTAETRLTLRDDTTDEILAETRVTLSGEQRQTTARLSFVPKRPGDLPLRIEASSIAGEQELDNNIIEETISVQDKAVRVLLVSAHANYEFRFLKNFLERTTAPAGVVSANFELHSVLQDADPLFVDQDSSALRLVPSQPERLFDMDAFVLVDFDPQLISQTSQQAIVDAVLQRGAGCVFVNGDGSSLRSLTGWPLAKLLPIERGESVAQTAILGGTSWRWQPTPLGNAALPMQMASTIDDSLAIWQSLPAMVKVASVSELKTGAQVLAQAASPDNALEQPLLIAQFAGAGRVVLQATDETYRWTSFQGTDLYYQRYWGQLLRWLSRGKLSGGMQRVELAIEPPQAKLGQAVRFQVKLAGQPGQTETRQKIELAIEGPAGRDTTLQLTRVDQTADVFQATKSDWNPGTYRARLIQPILDSPPSQQFTVTAPAGEQAVLRTNVDGLQQLAQQSRGRAYLAADAQRMFEQLPVGKPTRLGALPSQPIWNAWWVALLFVVLISCEWMLRRRVQML